MSRHFERDFTTDLLTVGAGGLSGVDGGPMTLIVVFRLDTVSGDQALIRARDSAGVKVWDLLVSGGQVFVETSTGFVGGAGGLVVNTWYMYAVGKGNGTAQVRDHLCAMTTGADTWTHTDRGTLGDGAGPVDHVRFSDGSGAHRVDGYEAAAAVYGSVLSDAAIEALRPGLAAWDSATPAAMWRLNDTPVVDLAGGGADQTAIDGTTIDLAQEPPGFSYTLGGPPAQAAAALSAAGSLTAAGRVVRRGAVLLAAVGRLTAAPPADTVEPGILTASGRPAAVLVASGITSTLTAS